MSTTRWTTERACAWDAEHSWLCGFNYLPSYAVNWTEFWQTAHFDPAAIARELGWARESGFNTCRVYLPFLLWQAEANSWASRVDRFLDIAERNEMLTLFVLFDDCSSLKGEPDAGPQGEPVPFRHNSRHAPSPGHGRAQNRALWPQFEKFVAQIVGRYANDARVCG